MNAVIGFHAAAQQTSKWYWNHLDTSWNSEFPYLETIQYNMLHFLVASKNPWWQSVYPCFLGLAHYQAVPLRKLACLVWKITFSFRNGMLFVVCSILVKYITCPHLKAWYFVYWISSISGPIFGIYIYNYIYIYYTYCIYNNIYIILFYWLCVPPIPPILTMRFSGWF